MIFGVVPLGNPFFVGNVGTFWGPEDALALFSGGGVTDTRPKNCLNTHKNPFGLRFLISENTGESGQSEEFLN